MSTRRAFLQTTAAGTALVVGLDLQGGSPAVPEAETFQPGPYLRLTKDGRARLVVPKTEMGQGVRTSLPAILADELDLPWDKVDLHQASPSPDFQRLQTGGSQSVTTLFNPLRQAAATARLMLKQAAAARWGIAPEACRTEAGFVHNPIAGKKLAYGALVGDAAKLPLPKEAPLKKPEERTLVGRDLRRSDAPKFVQGTAVFGQDITLPGMVMAAVAHCPVPGGKPRTWNEAKAKAQPGVLGVVPVPTGVAVLAERTDLAFDALEALAVTWDEGPNAAFDTEALRARLTALLDQDGAVTRKEGEARQTLATAPKRLTADYTFAAQAHAGIEPPACLARPLAEGGMEVWAGTQHPNDAQRRVAAALGLAVDQVKVNVLLVGGGFGRRLSSEFIVEAALVAKGAGRPVKLVWNREDDFRGERHHPMSLHRMTGSLDAEGRPQAWQHRVAAPSILLSWGEGKRTPAIPAVETNGALDIPYAIPEILVDYVEGPEGMPYGWWRAIEVVPNVFARECFLDELAHAARKDPLAFRLDLLKPSRIVKAGGRDIDTGRLAAVLELAAEKAGWGRPRPKGRGLGIACVVDGGTYLAEVAEVSVTPGGRLTLHQVTAAVDCGLAVNPRSVAGQVEGGIAFGLSAAFSAATFKAGRIQETSYSAFPILAFKDAPRIETHLVPSQQHPTGMGEPPVPPAIPALLNAVFAATGKRLRTLPIRPEDLKA